MPRWNRCMNLRGDYSYCLISNVFFKLNFIWNVFWQEIKLLFKIQWSWAIFQRGLLSRDGTSLWFLMRRIRWDPLPQLQRFRNFLYARNVPCIETDGNRDEPSGQATQALLALFTLSLFAPFTLCLNSSYFNYFKGIFHKFICLFMNLLTSRRWVWSRGMLSSPLQADDIPACRP